MSISAHRPGRFDSQGRILLDPPAGDASESATEPIDLEREFVPDATGSPAAPSTATPVDDAETVVIDADAEQPVRTGDTAVIDDDLVFAHTARRKPTAAAWLGAIDEADADPKSVPAPQSQQPDAESEPEPEFPVYVPERERVPLSRKLAVLGGAEGQVLDRVPTETPRYVQMFFVLLGTAVVSALSMFFALLTGVQLVAWVAIPLAIVWALIIFNLDRFLTSTMKSSRNVWKLIGLAIPRVIMAAIIGVVVAEPLVLQVFHNDISREVTSTNISQSLADQESLETGPEKTALDAATQKVADLENQAATGIVAGTSSESATSTAARATVDSLTAQMAEQQTVIDKARAIYQCELTGEGAGTVEGCTGVSGEGASSGAAEQQLAAAQTTYDALAAKLRDAQAALAKADEEGGAATSANEATNRAAAKDQLPAAQTSYETALAAYNARAESVAGTNAGAVGLLSQITALNALGEKEPALKWAHLLIAALFFMIELLPVLVKVLTSHGEKSLYEKADDISKQVELDRVTADGFRERAAIATRA